MRLPTTSATSYRRVTLVALVLVVGIVVTGAAVRLTGSGLGCSDWPACEHGRLVAPLQLHPMVEFLNRTITGLVSIAVVVAVSGSLRRTPRRRDLVWLSLGLVAGVVSQIVLGGIVVLLDLNPVAVQGHFLLSIALVADALVLHLRAREDGAHRRRPVVGLRTHRLGAAVVILAGLVLVTGTVVTGAGPHAGDVRARRLDVAVHSAARVHGTLVLVLLGVVIALVAALRRDGATAAVVGRAEALVGVLVLQAAIGYTQYFTGIPALLVALHVLGATLVWIAALAVLMGLSAPVGPPVLRRSDRAAVPAPVAVAGSPSVDAGGGADDGADRGPLTRR